MKKLLTLVFCIGLVLPSHAQLKQGYYLPFYLGYTHHIVKDATIGPVSYSGSAGSIATGFKSQGEKWIDELEIIGNSGLLSSDVAPDNGSSIFLIGGRAYYKIARKLAEVKGGELHLGLQSNNYWDYRTIDNFGNSSESFTGLFGLGPYASYQRKFALFGQDFNVQYELNIPAAAYTLRPGFVRNITVEGIGTQGFVFWNNYFQVDSKSSLYWRISNENYLVLTYRWEYLGLSEKNKVQTAQHMVGFSILAHL